MYTKAEVDAAISKAQSTNDAMQFAGVITALPTSTENIGNGYTYKVSGGGFNVTIDDETVTLKAGDLLIATGVEGADGFVPYANIAWQYVPSGDDIDTYAGKAIEHGLEIVRKATTDQTVGSLALGAGTGITLTDNGSGTSRTVSVALTAVNGTTTAETAASQASKGSLSFDVVSGVTFDTYGRVTAVKTKKITVVDTHNALNTNTFGVSTASNVATVTNTVSMTDGESKAASFKLKSGSSNLSITSSGTEITLGLVWGTF